MLQSSKSNADRTLHEAALRAVAQPCPAPGTSLEGYRIPFSTPSPPLTTHFKEPRGYAPGSLKGQALRLEIQQLKDKDAIEEAPPTLGFYSHTFVVPKAFRRFHPKQVCRHHKVEDGEGLPHSPVSGRLVSPGFIGRGGLKSHGLSHRQPWAIRLGLQHFVEVLQNSVVAVFSDNTTALAYLKREGVWGYTTVDLFATRLNYRIPNFVSSFQDPQAIATDAV
ncbi:hypothetical protein E2C01_044753 [Portunus trituberculatus]|uniref:Uncharacterized protein n=1 Tax=Portunus trituberculatus TaxID=210409 RepID=A0A5B7G0C5_PORTR|nr:hypothetical protein [Portunus trituberculatus]